MNMKRISGRDTKLSGSLDNLLRVPKLRRHISVREEKTTHLAQSCRVYPPPTETKRQNSGHEENCPNRRTILYHVPNSSASACMLIC